MNIERKMYRKIKGHYIVTQHNAFEVSIFVRAFQDCNSAIREYMENMGYNMQVAYPVALGTRYWYVKGGIMVNLLHRPMSDIEKYINKNAMESYLTITIPNVVKVPGNVDVLMRKMGFSMAASYSSVKGYTFGYRKTAGHSLSIELILDHRETGEAMMEIYDKEEIDRLYDELASFYTEQMEESEYYMQFDYGRSSHMNDGGPAFPLAAVEVNEYGVSSPFFNHGMTLRDYLAGQALSGLSSLGTENSCEYIADWAYSIADAMLARRKS